MTVPKILNDTGTDTFFRYQIFTIPIPVLFSGTKFFRYRFRDFFPVPNFTDTGSETFFRYLIFPIPVPILCPGTKFFRYWFRYFFRYQIFPIPVPRLFSGTKFFRYQFRDFFPVLIFSDTSSDTTRKIPLLYRYLYGTHHKSLSPKFWR